MRSGVITQKLGMTRIFTEDGRHIPVTVLKVDNCQVIGQRLDEKDGYTALQLGAGLAKIKNVSRPRRGQFAVANVEPRRKLAEFRISPDNLIEIGAEIIASHFVEGQYVDASGISIGKGFAGAMKRYHFKGLRATHGVSVSHRSLGATGQCQDPGKVFKGKKMAGHMGAVRVTTQNLEVVKTDVERGLIMVKGAVPGARGGWVFLRDAVKKALPENAPVPGDFRIPSQEKQTGKKTGEEATKTGASAEQDPVTDESVEAAAKTETPAKQTTAEEVPETGQPTEEPPAEAEAGTGDAGGEEETKQEDDK